jgi:hypothetical protein
VSCENVHEKSFSLLNTIPPSPSTPPNPTNCVSTLSPTVTPSSATTKNVTAPDAVPVVSFADKVKVKFPTSLDCGVPVNVREEASNFSHDGVLLDIEYDIVGVLYEKVEGENVNEKGWAATANGGTWALTGKASCGTAWTRGVIAPSTKGSTSLYFGVIARREQQVLSLILRGVFGSHTI